MQRSYGICFHLAITILLIPGVYRGGDFTEDLKEPLIATELTVILAADCVHMREHLFNLL